MGVDEGQRPGHDELGECEQNADVDGSPDLDLVDVLEVRRAYRQHEVVDQREDHEAPEKPIFLPCKS
jgi:hypothetical protein